MSAQRSRAGIPLDELASWLQKAIRRGEERDALFAATELDLSGYGAYCWRRLQVIVSEDVGLAWPEGPAVIRALYETWEETRKREKNRPPERSNAMLQLVHGVLLLCRAPKSRVVDDACAVMYVGPRPKPAVPECAVDHHTAAGRAAGRTEAECYDESYRLENEAPVENPYRVEARAIELGNGQG